MGNVRRSLVLSFAERYSAVAITVVSMLILARLLTPRDIGVYSIAAVVVHLAHTVRDFGLGEYIVQERELTLPRLRTAFGVGISIAWGIAGLLALASQPVAAFYAEPGVGEVMRILALNFVLLPFTTVPIAMWRRDMRFGPPYVIKTVGGIAHAVTSVSLAMAGFGYASLAWAPVVGTATTMFMGNVFFRHRAMPWIPGLSDLGRIVKFTSFASSAAALRATGSGVPDLVIGKVLGMAEVGLFGRATSVIRLFEVNVSAGIRAVSISTFAQALRRGDDVRALYLKALELFTGLAWPFFAVLAVLAYPTVRILFGPQWDAAVPAFTVMCLYGAVRAPFQLSGQALIATGAVKSSAVLEAVLVVAVTGATLAAAPGGLEAIAASLGAAGLTSAALAIAIVRRHLGFGFGGLFGVVRRSGALALATVVPALLVVSVSSPGPLNFWGPGLAGGVAAVVAWLTSIFLLKHALRAEILLAWRHVSSRLRGSPD
jgi:O-antigen/teichoic acid export membrane protein